MVAQQWLDNTVSINVGWSWPNAPLWSFTTDARQLSCPPASATPPCQRRQCVFIGFRNEIESLRYFPVFSRIIGPSVMSATVWNDQGRSQKFVLGGIKVFGRYKTLILMFNYRFDVILPHKKVYLDWFWEGVPVYTPCRYAPGNDVVLQMKFTLSLRLAVLFLTSAFTMHWKSTISYNRWL